MFGLCDKIDNMHSHFFLKSLPLSRRYAVCLNKMSFSPNLLVLRVFFYDLNIF